MFFSLFFLVEQKLLLLLFSSKATHRTANSEVLFQMAAQLRTSSLLKAEEIAGFEPTIWCAANKLPVLLYFIILCIL
jgi:hypothetical protein